MFAGEAVPIPMDPADNAAPTTDVAVTTPTPVRFNVFAVISEALTVPTVMFGEPIRPRAVVAIPTTSPVRVPLKSPSNVVAVITPRVAVILLPILRSVNVETPVEFTFPVTGPVNLSPTNSVAVTTPVALICPRELIPTPDESTSVGSPPT